MTNLQVRKKKEKRIKEGLLLAKQTFNHFSTTVTNKHTNLLSVFRQERKSLHTRAEEPVLHLAQGQLGGRLQLLGALVFTHVSEAIGTNASPLKNITDGEKRDPSFLCNK